MLFKKPQTWTFNTTNVGKKYNAQKERKSNRIGNDTEKINRERERIGTRSYIERNGNERSYKQEVLQELHLIITTTLEKKQQAFARKKR